MSKFKDLNNFHEMEDPEERTPEEIRNKKTKTGHTKTSRGTTVSVGAFNRAHKIVGLTVWTGFIIIVVVASLYVYSLYKG